MNTEKTPSPATEPGRKNDTPGANRPALTPQKSPPAATSEKKESGPHLLTWLFVIIIVAAAVLAIVLLGHKKPKTHPAPPVAITTAKVQSGNIAVTVPRIGSVMAIYTATMSPRVDGQVISVNYTEGQMVSSNDLLAVIDPGPYQAALLQAEGQLERDTNLLAGANVDLQRYQAAYAKNAIAKQQVDDQLALVHQDEGTVKLDEGNVAAAKVNVEYCYIRAPFTGRVGLRLVDPGNVVHAANSNAMVVVVQLQPITVVFSVAEDDLPAIMEQLKQGHDMTVEAWDRDLQNKLATGKVLALDNMIDGATGTVRIRAIFANQDLNLFPNQFVNAKLIVKTLHNQCLVPDYAIQHNPEGAFVYLVTNAPPAVTNRVARRGEASAESSPSESEPAVGMTNAPGTNVAWATMRNITPGITDGNTTAVTEGLAPGEQIALDNFNKLGEGVKISVHPQGEAGTNAPASRHRGGSYGQKTEDPAPDNKDNK